MEDQEFKPHNALTYLLCLGILGRDPLWLTFAATLSRVLITF